MYKFSEEMEIYNTTIFTSPDGKEIGKGLYTFSYKKDRVGGDFPVVGNVGTRKGFVMRGYKTNTVMKSKWYRDSSIRKEKNSWGDEAVVMDVNLKLGKEVISVMELLKFFCEENFISEDEAIDIGRISNIET